MALAIFHRMASSNSGSCSRVHLGNRVAFELTGTGWFIVEVSGFAVFETFNEMRTCHGRRGPLPPPKSESGTPFHEHVHQDQHNNMHECVTRQRHCKMLQSACTTE